MGGVRVRSAPIIDNGIMIAINTNSNLLFIFKLFCWCKITEKEHYTQIFQVFFSYLLQKYENSFLTHYQ